MEQNDITIVPRKNAHKTLIPSLQRLLPSSLPVLRRIQYDFAFPSDTAYYLVSANVISVFHDENCDLSDDQKGNSINSEPWIAAFVDLFAGRETQVWVYSSLEAEVLVLSLSAVDGGNMGNNHDHNQKHDNKDNDNNNNDVRCFYENDETVCDFSSVSPERQDIAKGQFLRLLRFINRHLMPEYTSELSKLQENAENQMMEEKKEKKGEAVRDIEEKLQKIPAHKAPAFLLGSLHTGFMKLLHADNDESFSTYENATFRSDIKVHRYDILPYAKYVFPPEVFQTSNGQQQQSSLLPPGYYYGAKGLLPKHVDLVTSRTHIPRERETLLRMPSVVIYNDGSNGGGDADADAEDVPSPIAWGFMAYDGELATLHVEPEHRGKGLAVALSKEVMRRGTDSGVFGSDAVELRYSHADVAKKNRASRRVMEKIGGQGWRWTVSWTVVEVLE